MKLKEFIDKYSEEMLEHIMPRQLFEKDLETLGWNSGVLIYLNALDPSASKDIVVINPNFYTEGLIVAVAQKSYIVADGETSFKINNTLYDSVSLAIEAEGVDILYDINNWDWEIVKEWRINTLNGDYINVFSEFENCPERTTIGG
tara:strand:+ start:796 stop:1233 length:438 start_codon:yes stop_codon:yes gene_type:complete